MSAVKGIYSQMMTSPRFHSGGDGRIRRASCQTNSINYSTRIEEIEFYQNSIISRNADVLSVFWQEAYRDILNANSVMEGVQQFWRIVLPGIKIRQPARQNLSGRSATFYLVNFFGEVPYLTSSDYRANSVAPRASLLDSTVWD